MQRKPLTDEELDKLLTEYMPRANILLDSIEEERDKKSDSHVFSAQYNKNIKRIIKEYSRTPMQQKFAAFRKYAAAILIIFILLNGVLVVTVRAYREKTFEIIIKVYKQFTSIIIETDEAPELLNENLEFKEPSYIPDGFNVISDIKTNISRIIDYVNDDKILVYWQSIISNSEFGFDTENTEIKEIIIDEHVIRYVFNKGAYNVFWVDNEYSYLITGEISFEELLRFVEGIIRK